MPISIRLWLLIVLNSSLALLLTGIGSLAYQRYVERSRAEQEILAQAGILAESTAAALSFEDVKAAQASLAALHGDSHIAEAVIFDQHGRIFAVYSRGAPAGRSVRALRGDGVYFEGDNLLSYQPVRVERERVGTIVLRHHRCHHAAAPLRRHHVRGPYVCPRRCASSQLGSAAHNCRADS